MAVALNNYLKIAAIDKKYIFFTMKRYDTSKYQ